MGTSFATPQQTESGWGNEPGSPPEPKRARLEPRAFEKTASPAYDFSSCGHLDRVSNNVVIQRVEVPCYLPSWLHPTLFGREDRAQPRWDRLPSVALQEVFTRLPANDKLSASLVCRAWQLPFSRPALWRRGNFRFDGVNDWRALCFASMMGGALRHVTIDCSLRDPKRKAKPSEIESTTEKLHVFLSSLVNSGNHKLATFTLHHLARLVKHLRSPSCDVIDLLSRLLAVQKSLTSFDLSFANLSSDDAFQVLEAVAATSGQSVRSLSIADVIRPYPDYVPATDPRLIAVLSAFTSIKELCLSNRFLSEEVLYLLALNLAGVLTHLRIFSENRPFGLHHVWTTREAWRHLKFKCPRLQVAYTVQEVCINRTFKEILTPSMPLTRLDWRQHRFETAIYFFKACLDHITTHFCDCLRHVTLDVCASFLKDEDDIASLIVQCVQLETLCIVAEGMPLPQRLRLETAIRHAAVRRSSRKLSNVTVNGQQVNLVESWATALVGWVMQQIDD